MDDRTSVTADKRGGRLDRRLNEGASLLVDSCVVRAEETQQVALDLVGDHLEHGREVLSFVREFDDRRAAECHGNGDPFGQGGALALHCGEVFTRRSEAVAEFAVRDLEAARRRPHCLGIVERSATVLLGKLGLGGAGGGDLLVQDTSCRVRHCASRIVGLGRVLGERVDRKLIAHVLEEVLLSPPFEHAIGDIDRLQVEPTGEDRCLMTVLGETRHLP
jgi:hypothetical protein